MSREKELLKRIEDDLVQEGFTRKKVYALKNGGIGLAASFFDAMVDLKLEGRDLTKEELWTEMKEYINFLSVELSKASEEYSKLDRRHRNLNKDFQELIKRGDFTGG
jgi:predicted transcriptional regulator